MSFIRIILVIVLVNAAGIALRYFEIDTYFIFLGFRFHLATIVPFIILLNGHNFRKLLDAFRNPYFKKKFLPVIWILLPLIILSVSLFFIHDVKPGDPDYFYEFGLSSIFDFPLYLVWNFPQLCLLFMTLLVFSDISRFSYLNVFIGLILLFWYEVIPMDSSFAYMSAISLVLVALIASFFVTSLQNIYWFSIIIFSSIWSIILLLGSKSEL